MLIWLEKKGWWIVSFLGLAILDLNDFKVSASLVFLLLHPFIHVLFGWPGPPESGACDSWWTLLHYSEPRSHSEEERNFLEVIQKYLNNFVGYYQFIGVLLVRDSLSNQKEKYQKYCLEILTKKIESIWYFTNKHIFKKKFWCFLVIKKKNKIYIFFLGFKN